MIDATERIYRHARKHGVEMRVDANDLMVRGPCDTPDDVRAALLAHKIELHRRVDGQQVAIAAARVARLGLELGPLGGLPPMPPRWEHLRRFVARVRDARKADGARLVALVFLPLNEATDDGGW